MKKWHIMIFATVLLCTVAAGRWFWLRNDEPAMPDFSLQNIAGTDNNKPIVNFIEGLHIESKKRNVNSNICLIIGNIVYIAHHFPLYKNDINISGEINAIDSLYRRLHHDFKQGLSSVHSGKLSHELGNQVGENFSPYYENKWKLLFGIFFEKNPCKNSGEVYDINISLYNNIECNKERFCPYIVHVRRETGRYTASAYIFRRKSYTDLTEIDREYPTASSLHRDVVALGEFFATPSRDGAAVN